MVCLGTLSACAETSLFSAYLCTGAVIVPVRWVADALQTMAPVGLALMVVIIVAATHTQGLLVVAPVVRAAVTKRATVRIARALQTAA